MCGRFTLRAPAAKLAGLFNLADVPDLPPRFNIAPTQPVAVVRPAAAGRELALLRWGLVPSWADDPATGLINARAETAADKPSFRSAFRRRRCLVPADGFYEWQKTDGAKQPWYFGLRDGQPFAFAGLWERWNDRETCTVLTTTANDLLRPIHDRMPVILPPTAYDLWLDPAVTTPEPLRPLLVPYPAAEMNGWPVSPWVNNPRHDDDRCLAPVPA